jgi:hypothetical protein
LEDAKRDGDGLVLKKEYDERRCRWDYSLALENDEYYSISVKMKGVKMSRVEEIKQAIDTLPEEEYIQLRHWFSEKDWQKWDMQIAADSELKKLDFLVKEALEAKSKNKLREL